MESSRKQQNKTWHNLINKKDEEIAKRYLKRIKDGSVEQLKAEFVKEINAKIDNTDEFEYGAVVALEGANLDSLYEQLNRVAAVLAKSGIKLNYKNILTDINEILNENAITVFQARRNSQQKHPAIMKIFENFINEILTKKAIEYALEKLNNSDL